MHDARAPCIQACGHECPKTLVEVAVAPVTAAAAQLAEEKQPWQPHACTDCVAASLCCALQAPPHTRRSAWGAQHAKQPTLGRRWWPTLHR
jgi:hypothetical protein